MSSLTEAYGEGYLSDSFELRKKQLIELITNNLSHRQFSFHLDNCDMIWNGNNLTDSAVSSICQSVNQKNACLKVRRIDLKRKDHRALLPYLIENERAEYFYIVDSQFNRFYVIYITPSVMGSF